MNIESSMNSSNSNSHAYFESTVKINKRSQLIIKAKSNLFQQLILIYFLNVTIRILNMKSIVIAKQRKNSLMMKPIEWAILNPSIIVSIIKMTHIIIRNT